LGEGDVCGGNKSDLFKCPAEMSRVMRALKAYTMCGDLKDSRAHKK